MMCRLSFLSPLSRSGTFRTTVMCCVCCLGLSLANSYGTSVGPAAVPVSVVRAVRDAGSARQSGPLICILVLGCRRSSISTHVSSVSHVSQSSSWHSSVSHVSQSSRGTWSSRCMQRRRHTLRTTPTHRHTTHNGRLSRTIGHRAANNSPHRWGGRQNPTHTGAAQTPYTSALARCGRRSPLRLNQERRRGHERLIRVDKFTSRMRSLSARTPKKVFLLPALALRRLVVH